MCCDIIGRILHSVLDMIFSLHTMLSISHEGDTVEFSSVTSVTSSVSVLAFH